MSTPVFLQQRARESARAYKARLFDYSHRVLTVLRDVSLKWLMVDGLVKELFESRVLASPALCDSMACEVHERLMEHIAKVAFSLAIHKLAPAGTVVADVCATTLPLSTAPTQHLFQPPSLLLYIASVLQTYTALRSFEAFFAPLLAAQRVPPRKLQDEWEDMRQQGPSSCMPRRVSDTREPRSGPAAATRGHIRRFCAASGT
jgi:hypothetical protein